MSATTLSRASCMRASTASGFCHASRAGSSKRATHSSACSKRCGISLRRPWWCSFSCPAPCSVRGLAPPQPAATAAVNAAATNHSLLLLIAHLRNQLEPVVPVAPPGEVRHHLGDADPGVKADHVAAGVAAVAAVVDTPGAVLLLLHLVVDAESLLLFLLGLVD